MLGSLVKAQGIIFRDITVERVNWIAFVQIVDIDDAWSIARLLESVLSSLCASTSLLDVLLDVLRHLNVNGVAGV